MQLRPLHDQIVVKRIEAETRTASGIFIPDNAQEKPHQGEVLAVGPGKTLDNGQFCEPQVKVGDSVFFRKYGGVDIKIDGEDYIIIREEDVLAIVG
jgi:chaperonin GroES